MSIHERLARETVNIKARELGLTELSIVKTTVEAISAEECAIEIIDLSLGEMSPEERDSFVKKISDIPLANASDSPYIIGTKFFINTHNLPMWYFVHSDEGIRQRTDFFRNTFDLEFYNHEEDLGTASAKLVSKIGEIIYNEAYPEGDPLLQLFEQDT